MDKYTNSFNIKVFLNNRIIKADIEVREEKEYNPIIKDLISGRECHLEGLFKIFLMKYKDQEGTILYSKSDRLSDAFYKICNKADTHKIKMLIKGCSLGYFMIPKLQNTIKAINLKIGERINTENKIVCIFDIEENINNIAPFSQILEYYKKWLLSIKGLPY